MTDDTQKFNGKAAAYDARNRLAVREITTKRQSGHGI